MLKKLLKRLFLLVLLLVVALGVFIWSPWSGHPPHRMLTLFWEDHRIANQRQMDQIFPSRAIKGSTQPFNFAKAERALAPVYEHEGETKNMQRMFKDLQVSSFMVIHRDKIVHESYHLGANAESRFTSWSMAKSVISTLIGMALTEGKIKSVNDPVGDYVPELKDSAYGKIPIKHVLQMSSGVDFDETYGSRFSDIQGFFQKVFMLGQAPIDVVKDYGTAGPSGEKFEYISLDTQVLSHIVSEVYNKPIALLVQEKLAQPLGWDNTYWNISEAGDQGTEIGFCCLNARTVDYAKFGRLFLKQGTWQGQQLIPQSWVLEATTASEPHLQPGIARKDRGYAYQWWIPPQPNREYMAVGVWGQYIYVSEPDDLIIVRTAVDPNYYPNVTESIKSFRAVRDFLRANP